MYVVTPEGLRPVKEIGIYGRIEVLHLYRPPVSYSAAYHSLCSVWNNVSAAWCFACSLTGPVGNSVCLSVCHSCDLCHNGFRWGSGSPINWQYWLTRCGPQPLQRISASWYRPVHRLGLCALPVLWCSSFLAYTPNWPIALFLLLLHPPGTLPADIRLCENILTFKRHLKTHLFKLI